MLGNEVYFVNKEIVSRKNNDGTIVLMRIDDSELFYKIDGIASDVFNLIDGKNTITNIIELIEKKHPQYKSKLSQDSNNFLNKLKTLGIITTHNS